MQLAAAGTPGAPGAPAHLVTDAADQETARALAFSEAAAIASLHAQAYSVINIRALVPVVLDLASSTFTKWRGLFLITLGKYALSDHVLADAVYPDVPSWLRMDCLVLSWLFGTISAELHEIVYSPASTARHVWLALEQQFIGNKETRALYLDAEFRNFAQGDLSISDYCRKLKAMADALGDLGEPVHDRTLVLSVLRGLNAKFSYMAALLKRQKPFPSFIDVRSDLLLEELTMGPRSSTPSTALVATAPAAPRGSVPGAPSGGGGGGGTGSSRRRRRNGNGKGGHSGNGSTGTPSAPPGSSANTAGAPPAWPPTVYNPWTGTIQLWPGQLHPRQVPGMCPPQRQGAAPPGGAPQPHALTAAHTYGNLPQPAPTAGYAPPQAWYPAPGTPVAPAAPWPMPAPMAPSWDQQALANAFSTMTLAAPPTTDWYMDSGASSHMTSDTGTLSRSLPPTTSTPSSIVVGDGSLLPVVSTGSTCFGSLNLNNVLVTPKLIKNLISVRQFTTDNSVSVEFDPFGLSVKDLTSRNEIVRCNSSGPLYPLHLPASAPRFTALLADASSLWHQRLGHLGHEALSRLASASAISCNKNTSSPICHACQLGRHVRLPFGTSQSRALKIFDLIHCDLWTSPVPSVSGYKYYLVILDDYSHYLWTFPLRLKSDTFATISHFFSYVATQFGTTIKCVQSDNGREFDNSSARSFFLTHGVALRMSCPYTSQQNGKAERIIRSTNNVVRSLMFQASLPSSYWVEALHTATYLLNRQPSKTLNFATPFFALYGVHPSYSHLRVFGCKCYPNLSATAPHKLAPRSTLCVFLGYPLEHKGYRCLDLATNRVIISRHVTFDESSFPFAERDTPVPSTNLDFLMEFDYAPAPIGPVHLAGTGSPLGAPVASTVPAPPGRAPASSVSPTRSVQAVSCAPVDHDASSPGAPGSPPTTAPPAPPAAVVAPCAPAAGPAPASASPGAVVALYAPADGPVPAPPLPVAVAASAPAAGLPPGAVPIPPVTNSHTMVTRGKRGFRQHVDRLNLHAAALSPVPTTYRGPLADPNWRQAMDEEFLALQSNNTWTLVPRPPNANIVTGKWIFRHKLNSDGTLDRYKARWVLRGFTQRPGVDFDETFSPVVKPATVRTVLTLALSQDWPVHQLDVKNAFLHGTLTETVYCSQPSGFVDSSKPEFVCRLNRSLYGLKQAPRAWYSRFASYLLQLGFVEAKSDTSLFIYRREGETVYLLLYVDDIVLTASSTSVLRRTIDALQREFPMKDLGPLEHFLGISVTRSSGTIFLSQRQYTLEILDRAGMTACKPCSTPVDTQSKVSSDGAPVEDATFYRSLAGALQYLTFTRPDIAYAVQQVCLYMHDPREPHLAAVKRILRYLCGTVDYGLRLHRAPVSDLVVYSDADWAGCPDTRKSTSGYAVFLGDNLVSWSSKRQHTVSRSSAEAEYRAVANAVAEASWLRQLLQELLSPLRRATLVYCDNVSAVYLSTNPVQHQRTKHVEIDLHFVRERVALGEVRVLHVPTSSQYADIFTKGLPTTVFTEFRSSLHV